MMIKLPYLDEAEKNLLSTAHWTGTDIHLYTHTGTGVTEFECS